MTPEASTSRTVAPATEPISFAPSRPPSALRRLAGSARRYRKILYLVLVGGAAAVVVAVLLERSHHVVENDARVRADMITIASRVDGWVAARNVTDGDTITKGQELVSIDERQTALQLAELHSKAESIRLQRERANTQLAMARTTAPDAVTAAEARRVAAEARQRAAASQLEQARRDWERANAVVDRIVPRERVDQRETQLRQAEEAERSAAADKAAAGAALADARAKLGDVEVLRKDMGGLEQAAAQIETQIRAREIDVGDRKVRSPIDGIVDEKFVQPGEYVAPGQRLLLIHDPKAVWVSANVKETKLTDLRPGQPVTITVDAYPDQRFTGHIERIGNAATSEFALLPSPNPSGNFTKIAQRVPIRIAVIQPPGNPLRPGMMVEVDIDTASR